MKSILLITSLMLLVVGCAQRSDESSGGATSSGGAMAGSGSQLSAEDTKFVRQAGQMGMAEVRMGQLLSQNAQDPALQSFGQRLVEDHTKANQQLAQLAAQKGLTLPTQMDNTDQRMVEQLAGLTGAEFDRVAQKDAVQAHERAVQQFQDAIQNCQDPDIKAFAQKTLPTLQEHLATAKKLSSSTESQGGTSSQP